MGVIDHPGADICAGACSAESPEWVSSQVIRIDSNMLHHDLEAVLLENSKLNFREADTYLCIAGSW